MRSVRLVIVSSSGGRQAFVAFVVVVDAMSVRWCPFRSRIIRVVVLRRSSFVTP